MLRLAGFILVANVLAATLIIGGEWLTGMFGVDHGIDYVFGMVVVLWGLSILFRWQIDDSEPNEDVNAVGEGSVKHGIVLRLNETRLYFRLFLAGLPAFALCVSYALFS